MLPQLHELDVIYGPQASQRVSDSSVLVVGAGGVGCELLKNLAIAGFPKITVIDLDTIDVSNLNRQFLFRRHHVGKSKATEAAKAVSAIAPDTKIIPIMSNIKHNDFNVNFFRSFTLVCNALDNLEARRHVNRMCLAAKVPLVESGSTGYNGQASVIANGVECYDCVQRTPQKTYAVCTIRSTPEKPVHCVVWAKYLFDLLFGPDDDANVLKDLDLTDTAPSSVADQNGDAADEMKSAENGHSDPHKKRDDNHSTNGTSITLQGQGTTQKRLRYDHDDTPDSFADRVAHRVFSVDIERQRAMKDLWRQRAPPLVCDVRSAAESKPIHLDKIQILSQSSWDVDLSAAVFMAVIKNIVKRRAEEIGSLTFDKDDRDAMLFVAAASNLRASAYGVPLQSPFAVKGIAGNIIHAIATTNALVGGLIVLEALKITTSGGDIDKCLTTFVSQAPRGSRVKVILCPEKLQQPNPSCFVCSKGQLHLSVDIKQMTLKQLIHFVLQKKLSMVKPDVYVTTGDYHDTLYESGEGLEEDEIEVYQRNETKKLSELKVENGSQLSISDFAQTLKCTIHISHVEDILEEKPPEERFVLDGTVPTADDKHTGDQENGLGAPEDLDEHDVVEVPAQDLAHRHAVANGKTHPAGDCNAKKPDKETAASAAQSAESMGAKDIDRMEEDKNEVVGAKRQREEENGREESAAKRVRS
ncbi:Ubiquitin activating enzyme alpha [Gracilaria domingensis]|nr:Ubiquitin activating enzyme alpha [Gracilaria domingensis]